MQDTDLFMELARIAGVFVGFGALIAVRSSGASEPQEVSPVRVTVATGVMAVIGALAPVTLGRNNLTAHQVLALSSVLVLGGTIGISFMHIRSPEFKAYVASSDGVKMKPTNVVGIVAWVLLAGGMALAPVIIILGVAPDLEAALYFTVLVLILLLAAWALMSLVGADNQRRSAELYDPVTGDWSAAGELAETPTWISLVATSGGALAVYAPADGRALRAEWFDPDQMAWSPAVDPGIAVGEGRAAMATLRDDRVLTISGDEARIFEPEGLWTRARSIPDGPRNDASAGLLADGSVLVTGGWSIGPAAGETGGCETPNPQAWRYLPAPEGSE